MLLPKKLNGKACTEESEIQGSHHKNLTIKEDIQNTTY